MLFSERTDIVNYDVSFLICLDLVDKYQIVRKRGNIYLEWKEVHPILHSNGELLKLQ